MELNAFVVYNAIRKANRSNILLCLLNALGVTAQTYLETGNYKSLCGSINLGGIKCSNNWLNGTIPWSTKRCINLSTQEFYGGEYNDVKAGFRWYDSLKTYLQDHARLVYKFYPKSKRNPDCVWGYISGLYGKWATDPNYFVKLVDIIVQISPELLGDNWLTALYKSYTIAQDRRLLTPKQDFIIKQKLRRD